jgi:hypothetical protein
MTATVLQTGGFLVLIGLVLGALGFGPQLVAATMLPGVAAVLFALSSGAAQYVPVPVRVRRRLGGR